MVNETLPSVDLLHFLGILEGTVTNYFRQQQSLTTLDYVKFGNVRQQLAIPTLTLDIDAGVASFSEHPVPDATQAKGWVRQAIQRDLVKGLQQMDAKLKRVKTIRFGYKDRPLEPAAAAQKQKAASSSNRAGILAACTGAAAAVVVLAGLLVFAKSRSKKHNSITDEEQPQPHAHPNASIAGSESEWTVNTEAGDSMALKSIIHNTISPQTFESFERDRQIAISKDMLVGQWSGNCVQLSSSNRKLQSDSVLQPSHFCASEEARRKRGDTESSEGSSDGESSSSSSSSSSSTSLNGTSLFQ